MRSASPGLVATTAANWATTAAGVGRGVGDHHRDRSGTIQNAETVGSFGHDERVVWSGSDERARRVTRAA